jgi:hypothetical protein
MSKILKLRISTVFLCTSSKSQTFLISSNSPTTQSHCNLKKSRQPHVKLHQFYNFHSKKSANNSSKRIPSVLSVIHLRKPFPSHLKQHAFITALHIREMLEGDEISFAREKRKCVFGCQVVWEAKFAVWAMSVNDGVM